MILVGTAGHVDHGKSALVEALTGIDPVHLPEERERGLTIELGFAHLKHPDGYTLGIVDVPGHERLVRTMISGATGFQLALWVVDAREGLMPQSLEHLEVLDLLGGAQVVPVVTKADLATPDEIEQTAAAVESALAGVGLARFPLSVVDSISGRGIPELAEVLFAACRSLELDPERLEAPVYMPIDRSFVLKGVGTVVTGTLVRGRLAAGDSVVVSSSPEPWRIRSLHNHNTQVDSITAGHRVGVHLHGIRADRIDRGDILVGPDYPFRSSRLNARLRLLEGTSFRMKHGSRALFLAASLEVECRLWGFVESEGGIWAQVQLPRELCFYPGQRFILRSTNPLTTIGGGSTVDLRADRLRKLSAPEISFYESGDLSAYLQESPHGIYEIGELARRWLRREADLRSQAEASGALETLETKIGGRAVCLVWHASLKHRALDYLRGIASGGMADERPMSSVAGALGVRTVHARKLLDRCLALGDAVRLKDLFTTGENTLRFDPEKGGLSSEERRIGQLLADQLAADQLRPSRLAEYARSSGSDRRTFDKVTGSLLKEGTIVRIDNEFALGREAWEELRRGLLDLPAEGVTPAEFGKRFGLTRKYTMPYIECLNRMGLMRRDGNRHVVVGEKVERSLSPEAR